MFAVTASGFDYKQKFGGSCGAFAHHGSRFVFQANFANIAIHAQASLYTIYTIEFRLTLKLLYFDHTTFII